MISDCVNNHELDRMNLYFLLDYIVQCKTMGNVKLYTAVSTKFAPRKCKFVRDNANWHYG